MAQEIAEDMTKVARIESWGASNNFTGEVRVKSEQYSALDEESRRKIGYECSRFIDSLQRKIDLAHSQQFDTDVRFANAEELRKLVVDSGFEVFCMTLLDNQYSPGTSWAYRNPIVELLTPKGVLSIGWRKRVINLSWSESLIYAEAEEMFSGEDVTKGSKGEKYIHCWGVEKAAEYLATLSKQGARILIEK